MLYPAIRATLTASDYDALAAACDRLPPRAARATRHELEAHGIDAVLAHPAFDPHQCWGPGSLIVVRLALYCYAIVRRTLTPLGVTDATLHDYVATLLVHFGDHARATWLDPHGEWTSDTLAALIGQEQAGTTPGVSRATLAQHRGDRALWLAGLYPARITAQVARRGAPGLPYYDTLGAQGYAAAARVLDTRHPSDAALLAALSEQFVVVRQGLNRLSARLLFPMDDPVERLLRDATAASSA